MGRVYAINALLTAFRSAREAGMIQSESATLATICEAALTCSDHKKVYEEQLFVLFIGGIIQDICVA